MAEERRCYDCKHYVKVKGSHGKSPYNSLYGCELWDCKFSQKEEPKHEKGRSRSAQG